MRYRRLIAALFLPAVLIGCDGEAAGPPEARAPLDIRRIERFEPGSTATLYGTSLKSLTELRLDGDSVRGLVVLTDTSASFPVPIMRSCETDGREVRMIANRMDTLKARLKVATVQMEVGESRVLQPQMGQCIALPARDEDYVLSAASLEPPTGAAAAQSLLVVQSFTGDPAAAALQALRFTAPRQQRHADVHGGLVIDRMSARFSNDPALFDPRYATAKVGDTVTMVAWTRTPADDAAICALPRSAVPTFNAVVLAAKGRTIVLADLRDSIAASLTTGDRAGWIQHAADIADPVMLPAMRSVFDPDYEPTTAAGGRNMVLMTFMPLGSGFAFDGRVPGGTGAPQSQCPHASEVITTIVNSHEWGRMNATVRYRVKALAATIIHEYAHNVDSRAHHNAGRPTFPAPSGMLTEAWASLAEETASRIAIGMPIGAMNYLVGDLVPDNGQVLLGMWGVLSTRSPWQAAGAYTTATQMLLFAREVAGESSVNHGRRPTFYQRLNASAPNPADRAAHARALAATAGMTLDSLVDMHALASATAGLLSASHALPSFRSWDVSDLAHDGGPYAEDFPTRVGRTGKQDVELSAAPGSFAAAYLMGEGLKGVSVRVDYVGPSRKVVRLTRVR